MVVSIRAVAVFELVTAGCEVQGTSKDTSNSSKAPTWVTLGEEDVGTPLQV